MMRSAHCYESLHCNWYNQEDTAAHADPGVERKYINITKQKIFSIPVERVVQKCENIRMNEGLVELRNKICFDNIKDGKYYVNTES